jgi:hypothetical protein
MKVRVFRVFRVPNFDTRITRNKFGFCKLLPEIPEQNSGFGYFGFGFSGFGFRVTGFSPSPKMDEYKLVNFCSLTHHTVTTFCCI